MKSTDCILIMGRRGCGKSYLSQRIQNIWPRRIILDTLGEYTEGDIVFNFHDFGEKLKSLKNLNSNEFKLIYQFDPENSLSQTEFDQIMRVCYYFGNIQIVIEEIQIYSNPHSMSHWLKQCLLTGRHQNLSLLFTTQRAGELHKTILSQCNHIFVGQMTEGNDLRYISSFLGESVERLISLQERRFLYFNPEKGISEISNDF